MAHSLCPRASIRIALQQSRRSISFTPSRLLPEVEEQTEEVPDSSSSGPDTFLSSRSETDAFLRMQNDVYLAKVKKHLESIQPIAEHLDSTLPGLFNRAASIRPPENSASASIPPYTVSEWQRSARAYSDKHPTLESKTKKLLQTTERVMRNIEDLQAEPYRADASPSQREKMNKRVADWTKEQKLRELFNAESKQASLEARFKMGIQRLMDRVKQAEQNMIQRSAIETANETGDIALNANGSATSRTPLSKAEGWGNAPGKVGEKGKYTGRIGNPFKDTASKSNAKDGMEAVKKKLQTTSTVDNQTPKAAKAAKAGTDAAESEAEPAVGVKAEAETKAEPKVVSLADLQRRMDASQGEKD